MPALKERHDTSEIFRARNKIDDGLHRFLADQRSRFADDSSENVLFENTVEFVCRPGKRIRPLLFLAGCQLFGAQRASKQKPLLQASLSLELLHAFILVHDDIIDQSELRRGLPTLHRALGARLSAYTDRDRAGHDLALVMGDILFALAQSAIVESGLPATKQIRLLRQLLTYTVQTGLGETADILYGYRDISKVSLKEIERMYLAKTTRYTFEAPLRLAAIAADLPDAQQQAIIEFVEPAGLAFQILNDLEEYEHFEITDVASSDILEGKKTVLMQTTYSRLKENDRTLLQMCLSGATGKEVAATKIRELVVRSGSIKVLRETCDRLFGEADRRISAGGFDPAVAQGLQDLLQAITALICKSKQTTA